VSAFSLSVRPQIREHLGEQGEQVSQVERTDVSRYYDLLHLWTRLNKGFRVFSGIEARAIHRWLDHPDSGDFSPATIHTIMLASGVGDDMPVVALDAGCGYGGTMFALQAALGGRWHGITISPRQCAVASKAAREKSVAATVTFACGSYDEPQPHGYNLIYGIESLRYVRAARSSSWTTCRSTRCRRNSRTTWRASRPCGAAPSCHPRPNGRRISRPRNAMSSRRAT
jgi:SAM-dependent methyltransferase